MIVVMGIDPGVANTGFGVVRVAGGQMSALDGGVINVLPGEHIESRLAKIHEGLAELLTSAQHGIPCFDYTPQAVKMAVCGSGAAAKRQVQHMVGTLLGLTQPPES